MAAKAPWPRQVGAQIVDKAFGPDGQPAFRWYISSQSLPGAWRQVSFHKSGTVAWWTCSGPCGHWGEKKMGAGFEHNCSHVRAVFAAEYLDGLPPRPTAKPNISALTD